MDKKPLKLRVLVVVYIILAIVELFIYVPYNAIMVVVSEEQVPHAEIIGSGYSTVFDIQESEVRLENQVRYVNKNDLGYGKRVNAQQLTFNITLTTIIATAIYFLFIFKKEAKRQHKQETVELPYIDFKDLAFADDETQARARQEYAEAMYRYVKSKIDE